jgi:hypothetical protein
VGPHCGLPRTPPSPTVPFRLFLTIPPKVPSRHFVMAVTACGGEKGHTTSPPQSRGRTPMSDQGRASRADLPPCPRCKAAMSEVASIAPKGRDPGLIAFECLRCGYVTSVLIPSLSRADGQ